MDPSCIPIWLDIVPKPKPRMTRAFWTPACKRYFAYADELRKLDPQVDWEYLELTFVMPIPKSWSKKKKKAMDGQPHRQVPDLDNLVKAFQDALLENDSDVWCYRNVKKVWGPVGGILILSPEQ
jgi:Holliday junction resolvase RusA-like endonuclease